LIAAPTSSVAKSADQIGIGPPKEIGPANEIGPPKEIGPAEELVSGRSFRSRPSGVGWRIA